MMIGYNLKYSKVIEQPIENSLLMIEGMYTYGLLSCRDHYSRIFDYKRKGMMRVFNDMSNRVTSPRDKNYYHLC